MELDGVTIEVEGVGVTLDEVNVDVVTKLVEAVDKDGVETLLAGNVLLSHG